MIPWPVLRTTVPRGQSVGRLHADRPHAAAAELLGDLGEHGDRLALDGDVELQGGVDLRQRVRWELDVDDGAGDADDATFAGSLSIFCNGHW